jgi:hypothetical protein
VAAQSALLALGPSFTPGAPDAGDLYSTPRNYGAGGGTGEAVIGENDTLVENYLPSYSLLSRYGDEQADSNLAANILSATGLGWPQLLLIALIGIALVGSMGYAMSRTGR